MIAFFVTKLYNSIWSVLTLTERWSVVGSTLSYRTPSLDEVQAAIDKGDRREALFRSNLIVISGKHFNESAFWYQRACLYMMFKNVAEATYCVSQARDLPGWSSSMEKIWQAKLLDHYIDPWTKLDVSGHIAAQKLLDEVGQETLTSINGSAWCASMRGTLYYKMAQKPFAIRSNKALYRKEALASFAAAESIWQQADESEIDQGARNNNRYLWFLTAAQDKSHQGGNDVVRQLLVDILEKDGDPQRKRYAFYAKPSVYVSLALRR